MRGVALVDIFALLVYYSFEGVATLPQGERDSQCFWPQNTWALWVILGQVYDILHSFWSQLRLPRTRSTMAN